MLFAYVSSYSTTVEPIFTYGCSVWASFLRNKASVKKIRSFQRSICRMITITLLLLLNRSFFFCQTYFRLIWKYLKLLLFVILPLLRMSVSTAPRATTFIIVFLSIEFPILDESPPSPPLGTSSVEDFSLRVLNSLLGSLFATELIWHSPLIYRRLSHTWQGWVLCGSLLLHCCPQDLKLVPTNGNFLPIWF
jgi:hypothetical protein